MVPEPALPLTDAVAAVSCGIVGGEALLDLDYPEDSAAEADANFVLAGKGGIVEIQFTAEKEPLPRQDLARLMTLAEGGIEQLLALQRAAVHAG